jgi:hypothetical protein
MPAILSSKPKRVREFILNGKIYAGGIEEAYSQRNTPEYNLGGNGATNGVPESPFKEKD